MMLISFEFTDTHWTFWYIENNSEKEITFYNIQEAENFNIENNFQLNLFGCQDC